MLKEVKGKRNAEFGLNLKRAKNSFLTLFCVDPAIDWCEGIRGRSYV